MLVSDLEDGLVNLNLAMHIQPVYKTDDIYHVTAYFNCAVGGEDHGYSEFYPYTVDIYAGTKTACIDYMNWLKRECDVEEYEPEDDD